MLSLFKSSSLHIAPQTQSSSRAPRTRHPGTESEARGCHVCAHSSTRITKAARARLRATIVFYTFRQKKKKQKVLLLLVLRVMKKGKANPFAQSLERDVDPQLRKLTFVRARCVLPSQHPVPLGRSRASQRPQNFKTQNVFLPTFSKKRSAARPHQRQYTCNRLSRRRSL
jgi:hypothetical protein